ncbi:GNAT family N-acetyltransferase [Nonomuraea fuscirosea]|uniref:GNAT family N-acetyltransferase n=1 Tax=Nonomuraea fuscirosea TaxID=1291556 RepID=UPI0034262EEB
MSFVRIRQGHALDAVAVSGLVQQVYQPFSADFPPTALKWTSAAVRALPASWLLAHDENKLVGVVRQGPDPEGHTLDSLAVATEWRRRGIGTALVAAVEELAVAACARQMIIALRDVLAANTAFFTALDYRMARPLPPHHHIFTKEIGTSL